MTHGEPNEAISRILSEEQMQDYQRLKASYHRRETTAQALADWLQAAGCPETAKFYRSIDKPPPAVPPQRAAAEVADRSPLEAVQAVMKLTICLYPAKPGEPGARVGVEGPTDDLLLCYRMCASAMQTIESLAAARKRERPQVVERPT